MELKWVGERAPYIKEQSPTLSEIESCMNYGTKLQISLLADYCQLYLFELAEFHKTTTPILSKSKIKMSLFELQTI